MKVGNHKSISTPSISEEEILEANQAYHDQVAEAYETDISTRTALGKFSQHRIREVINLYHSKTKGRFFLDLACGTGNVLGHASTIFPIALGIDISTKMLGKAVGRGLNCVRSDVCKLPVKSGSVDMVSCFSAMHHLYNFEEFFVEVHRVLSRGGVLYTDFDPNSSSLQIENSRLYKVLLFLYLRTFSKFRRLSHKQAELEGLAKKAEYHWQSSGGFDPEDLKDMLLRIGFSHVNVIYHSDCISIHRTKKISFFGKIDLVLKALFSWQFAYSELARYFILIAEK